MFFASGAVLLGILSFMADSKTSMQQLLLPRRLVFCFLDIVILLQIGNVSMLGLLLVLKTSKLEGLNFCRPVKFIEQQGADRTFVIRMI